LTMSQLLPMVETVPEREATMYTSESGSTNQILEGDGYTVMSLCDDLSMASEDVLWSDGSCCACPDYTTVPCSC